MFSTVVDTEQTGPYCSAGYIDRMLDARHAQQAAYKAVDDYVKSGTTIGLGTGSTSFFAGECAIRLAI